MMGRCPFQPRLICHRFLFSTVDTQKFPTTFFSESTTPPANNLLSYTFHSIEANAIEQRETLNSYDIQNDTKPKPRHVTSNGLGDRMPVGFA